MFQRKYYTFQFSTDKKFCLINITDQVKNRAEESGLREGLCVVQVSHATAGLLINEDEAGLKEDIMERILALAPETDYKHDQIDNNARAHIISSIIGSSKTLIIKDAQLRLGTWQEIFFVELDGPRSDRVIEIEIIGE